MDILRINKESLKFSHIPIQHCITKLGDTFYYIGNGVYDKEYISQKLKEGLNYYIALEVILVEDILQVTRNFYFIAYKEEGLLIDKVEATYEMLMKHPHKLKDIILWQLYASMDLDSVEGRKVAYRNFDQDYNPVNHNLPEDLSMPTKEIDEIFAFQISDKLTSDYVPLKKIVGTTHPSYAGLSWFDIYLSLNRGSVIAEALITPEYYYNLQMGNIEPKKLSFIEIEGEYYVYQGNHRVTLAKIKGVDGIFAPVVKYQVAHLNKLYYETFLKWGFNVDLIGKEIFYYNIIHEKYFEHEWEAFRVVLPDIDGINLYNEEMMEAFRIAFENLETNKWIGKLKDVQYFAKKCTKIIKWKEDAYNDEWYQNNIIDAVQNFFLKNNQELIAHKERLIGQPI